MHGRSTVGVRQRSRVPLSLLQCSAKEEEEEGTMEFGVRTPPPCRAPGPFDLGGPGEGEGGRRRGGQQGERGLRGRGRGEARVEAMREGSEGRVAYLHMRGGSEEGEARRRGRGRREEAEGRRKWNRVWGPFIRSKRNFSRLFADGRSKMIGLFWA
jgi:hypothetical protein